MHTKVLTWLSIAALLSVLAFWNSAPAFQLQLNLVVCVTATAVLIQAFQAQKHRWAAGFLATALLFNPAIPLFRLAGGVGLALVILSVTLLAISLAALRPPPLLSVPSITDRTPGSQSL
jgi:uncharacterized protein DUF6804